MVKICEGCGKPLPEGVVYHDKLCRALAKRKRWRQRNREFFQERQEHEGDIDIRHGGRRG